MEGAIGSAKGCWGSFSGDIFERVLVSRKGVSKAFWGAIGNKVNDIPCSHFCAETYANQEFANQRFTAHSGVSASVVYDAKAVRLLDERNANRVGCGPAAEGLIFETRPNARGPAAEKLFWEASRMRRYQIAWRRLAGVLTMAALLLAGGLPVHA